MREMACRLLPAASAMPVDTLFRLGASPPMTLPFLSQRYTATSFMYVAADKVASGRHNGQRDKLRPCIRGSYQVISSVEIQKDCTGLSLENMVDSAPNVCDSIPISSLAISADDVGTNVKATLMKAAKKSSKRVCFADSKGLALENVRVMDGPSSAPPILKSRLLQEIIQDERPELFHTYTYVVDFEQPASNYLEFRDKLEKNCISLENVLIRDNTTVMGTIKVKNMSFEKSVAVRVSFDGWKTFTDIRATYVQKSQSGKPDRYDSFSFSFDIPTNKGGGEAFEFCLCYHCNGRSYWDSRGGENYRIISQHEKSLTEQQKMASYYSLSSNANWGDFSFWKVMDERPYW